MHKQLTCIATIHLLLVLLAPIAHCNTLNLSAVKDNSLYENDAGLLSNGTGNGLFVGKITSGLLRRGLLQFDIAAELPSSAMITNATLTMQVTKVPNSISHLIELRRVSTDWGEGSSHAGGAGGGGTSAQPGDATWKHRFSPGENWNNLGGDFSDTVSATQSINGLGTYQWNSAQLLSDVQNMLDTPNNNFGWILLGDEAATQSAKRFGSRESTTPPVLTLEFDLPNESPADLDKDGDVDGDDLANWSSAFGIDNSGDIDGDADTDGVDFLAWQQEFTGPNSANTFSIPEPTSLAMTLYSLALFTLNRRSRAQ